MKLDLKKDTLNKPALIILSGCPGAGKSTWGKKFSIENNVVYVSTDEIRKELSGDESNQSVSRAAFVIARSRISAALGADKSAMIDATSVSRKARKDWINLGRGHGAFIIAVTFEVPREELLRRDAQRERHVGSEVVDRFLNKYERPDSQEGIDRIIFK